MPSCPAMLRDSSQVEIHRTAFDSAAHSAADAYVEPRHHTGPMSKVRDRLSHPVKSLRRLGRFLFPEPPEWGWAPPVQEQNLDTNSPGWHLANSLMFVFAMALALSWVESGGWRIFFGVMLVVAVSLVVFVAVLMARRRGRRRSADDHGRREPEGNPE
jgi:hypothetical protein